MIRLELHGNNVSLLVTSILKLSSVIDFLSLAFVSLTIVTEK